MQLEVLCAILASRGLDDDQTLSSSSSIFFFILPLPLPLPLPLVLLPPLLRAAVFRFGLRV